VIRTIRSSRALNNFYRNPICGQKLQKKQECSDREIGEVIVGISELLNAGDFQTFDDFLRDSDVGNTSIIMMTTCLRTPFLARDRLPNWKTYLQRSYVKNRGQEDPDELFRGLM